MARLNTHPSATPQPSRSATVDSLYRDPTPVSRRPRGSNNARTSSYPVISPSRSHASDKENDEPRSRDITPQPSDRRKKMAPPRLPTPTSGSGSANKRRRTNNYTADDTEVYVDDDASEVQPTDDADPADPGPAFVTTPDEDEDEATKYYDPQQDPEIRRKVRANIRNHQREMEDNRDELVRSDNNMLIEHLKRQDYYMAKVRQTADAALDSRVMVLASDLAGKKLNNSLHGNAGVGVDIDQFVSKCIYFMKSGGHTLTDHIENAGPVVDEELSQYGDGPTDEQVQATCQRHRVAPSPDDELCVSLFDFVINPTSFGQTVENLFYVSFLIREGAVQVLHDNDGLPLLMPAKPRNITEQRENNIQKHQAVLSLDWSTWESLIKAFDIKTPLIPNRTPEEVNLQGDRWYA
ncbi:Nse4-domain-containing protein [Corynespora cassiicola Philippines]|uniref:Non-structural maintenance of chromosomes element 4 n=1 Tax=Corynespora cassiicola Philippines TaxID=1448308 RepID=A0A2T2PAJ9_CORCC|nr:Nse4-domain-containing protein [Corynespora cassiicola Philippines]